MGIILFNYNNLKVLYNIEGEPGFRPLMGIILFIPAFEITGIYWPENAKNGGDYKTDLKSTLAH